MGTAAWRVKARIPSRAVGKHLLPHQKRDLGQEVILIQTSSWEIKSYFCSWGGWAREGPGGPSPSAGSGWQGVTREGLSQAVSPAQPLSQHEPCSGAGSPGSHSRAHTQSNKHCGWRWGSEWGWEKVSLQGPPADARGRNSAAGMALTPLKCGLPTHQQPHSPRAAPACPGPNGANRAGTPQGAGLGGQGWTPPCRI